jgi:hypothetical protein
MQDAKVFEKLAKPDFSKTCGRRLRLRHTNIPICFLLKATWYQA